MGTKYNQRYKRKIYSLNQKVTLIIMFLQSTFEKKNKYKVASLLCRICSAVLSLDEAFFYDQNVHNSCSNNDPSFLVSRQPGFSSTRTTLTALRRKCPLFLLSDSQAPLKGLFVTCLYTFPPLSNLNSTQSGRHVWRTGIRNRFAIVTNTNYYKLV